MADHTPRIRVPKKAAKGDVVEIKTLISHQMESGQRKDKQGQVIPREIINKFTCAMNGETVFSADLEPAISANPYLSFYVKVEGPADLKFTWVDDNGSVYEADAKIAVA
ncbi:sulfur compound chelating protein SoxZ [Tistlia consotensis]|uniref:Sulfur compound chelating protein SoxZ n=1 Tax=Tistlia consotensis USBA 355 TaxID=560819 RepID=A0A1Y6B479_9PROT|nr:thiosulfate oxidation carrier complex protein SoxZ [Tistlia consotensis]SME89128.1 sulfur compound chelating protein SoxZ [Tistlia consotensis USBA 355]SNR25699.1 sulfur compound chelating protein SoxZ [Tistlia consotensis]